jgi:hypothetical protein
MAISPTPLRITVAVAVFGVLAGSIYWLSRVPVRLAPPRPASRAAFTAPPQPAGDASIDGVVLGQDGTPQRAEVALMLGTTPAPSRGGPIRGRRYGSSMTTPDGHFSFAYVSANQYLVVAHVAPRDSKDDHGLWAAAEIVATSEARSTANLTLRSSGRLTGQIVLEPVSGVSAEDFGDATVTLEPFDTAAKASLFGGAPQTAVRADGRFTLGDVPPGQYLVQVALARPWLIDRVVANGRDSFGVPVTIEPGDRVTTVTIGATDVATHLEGLAIGADGRPASLALVFAFAADASLRAVDRRMQAVRADRTGHFAISGLPSGDYLVAIAAGAPPAAWYSPKFFADLARDAVSVRLGTAATRVVTVGGPARGGGRSPK